MSSSSSYSVSSHGQPKTVAARRSQDRRSKGLLGLTMTPLSRDLSARNVSEEMPNPSSRHSIGHRTLFNDPDEVQQWVAAASATESSDSPLDFSGIYNDSYPDVQTTGLSQMESSCAMIASASHFSSISSQTGFSGFNDSLSQDSCSAPVGEFMTPDFSSAFSMDSAFLDDTYSIGDNFGSETWANPTSQAIPSSADMVYTTSADSHRFMNDYYPEDNEFQPYWSKSHAQSQNGLPDYSKRFSAAPVTWSPSAVAIDPSVSSSYSQGSFFPQHAESPTSFSTQEDQLPMDPSEGISPLSIEAPALLPYSSYPYDLKVETTSTLRPRQVFPRPPLPALWSNYESGSHQPMNGSTVDDMFPGRRFHGEGDNGTARRDELYQVGAREDGLYHCPFESTAGCGHKPDKLKCNYDKHLDSHLKPYRCKVSACGSVPFSSTACLLRHEREAHGMHGHGDKPYLCSYEDCERSFAGNGFPRRWNLQDHMKRVHSYIGPPSTGSSSPAPSSASSRRQSQSQISGQESADPRKKRASLTSQTPQVKRTKPAIGKNTPRITKGQAQQIQAKQRQSLEKQWLEEHAAMKERLASLDPTDAGSYEKIEAHYTALASLGRNLQQIETCD